MSQYITKQRQVLLKYFEEHIDEPVCAKNIMKDLKNENISASAIYRNLAYLEKEDKLQKISINDSGETFYRYKAFEKCRGCLHLSCKRCGKTFHLNTPGTKSIESTLSDTENFTLDRSDTILYGICGDCGK